MGELLSIHNLKTSLFTHRAEVEAIRGVSLVIQEGEIVGLVGESGCGKSMTALSIMGLLPSFGVIKDGQILFKGDDLTAMSEQEFAELRGKEISMIFQDPLSSLNPVLRIGEQVGESLVHHKKLSSHEARLRAISLLEEVGIPDPEERMDDFPHQFSGGMRQRVMIAAALSCEPSLLIADEPTTALDVTVQAQILNLIKKLQKRHRMAVMIITHDLGVIAGLCDRVMIMYAGKIMETADTESLFRMPLHPYTATLLSCRPRVDATPKSRLINIGGMPPSLVNPPPGCPFLNRCPIGDEKCREEQEIRHFEGNEREVACWKADQDRHSDNQVLRTISQQR